MPEAEDDGRVVPEQGDVVVGDGRGALGGDVDGDLRAAVLLGEAELAHLRDGHLAARRRLELHGRRVDLHALVRRAVRVVVGILAVLAHGRAERARGLGASGVLGRHVLDDEAVGLVEALRRHDDLGLLRAALLAVREVVRIAALARDGVGDGVLRRRLGRDDAPVLRRRAALAALALLAQELLLRGRRLRERPVAARARGRGARARARA
mmetsp:Transcript_16327/g.53302  ORF Transcript_16327/g.53302 Transcript_16327/m.53302 type:complete len:210 (+) Transcript_16327:197-826(+)